MMHACPLYNSNILVYYIFLLKIPKTNANYAAKKLSLMNMLKALKMTLELRSAITILMCLTYTKIISNKLGIQFL